MLEIECKSVKSVGKDRVFLGLAGLLLGISLVLFPREILWSSPASPRKTPHFPPLLLRLTPTKGTYRYIYFFYISCLYVFFSSIVKSSYNYVYVLTFQDLLSPQKQPQYLLYQMELSPKPENGKDSKKLPLME